MQTCCVQNGGMPMPDYTKNKVSGCYVYFTSYCILEAFHAHAAEDSYAEASSAKFFIYEDGSSYVQHRGTLSDKQISEITKYISKNHKSMLKQWQQWQMDRGVAKTSYFGTSTTKDD